jgi:hypothetical protein
MTTMKIEERGALAGLEDEFGTERDAVRAVAYHEAGHAAAWWLCGRPVGRVNVSPGTLCGDAYLPWGEQVATSADSRKRAVAVLAGAGAAVLARRPPSSGRRRPPGVGDVEWMVREAVEDISRRRTQDWEDVLDLARLEARLNPARSLIECRPGAERDVEAAERRFVSAAIAECSVLVASPKFKWVVSHLAGVLLKEERDLYPEEVERELRIAAREFEIRSGARAPLTRSEPAMVWSDTFGPMPVRRSGEPPRTRSRSGSWWWRSGATNATTGAVGTYT